MIRKRNSLFNRAKKRANQHLFQKYKKVRNKVTAILRLSKRTYFQSLSPHDSKQFWKSLKYVSKKETSIPLLSHNNTTATTDIQKANMLNEYFATCANQSQPALEGNDFLEYAVEMAV